MATFSLTTPANQDARILAAFGKRLNLGRDATGAEVKQQLIVFMQNAVQEQEMNTALASAAASVTLVTPT